MLSYFVLFFRALPSEAKQTNLPHPSWWSQLPGSKSLNARRMLTDRRLIRRQLVRKQTIRTKNVRMKNHPDEKRPDENHPAQTIRTSLKQKEAIKMLPSGCKPARGTQPAASNRGHPSDRHREWQTPHPQDRTAARRRRVQRNMAIKAQPQCVEERRGATPRRFRKTRDRILTVVNAGARKIASSRGYSSCSLKRCWRGNWSPRLQDQELPGLDLSDPFAVGL